MSDARAVEFLWADRISDAIGPFGYRVFVDSAPVLEKALAEKAGLGWIGKHSNLLSLKAGSWFFIGEIYTDLRLPADRAQRRHAQVTGVERRQRAHVDPDVAAAAAFGPAVAVRDGDDPIPRVALAHVVADAQVHFGVDAPGVTPRVDRRLEVREAEHPVSGAPGVERTLALGIAPAALCDCAPLR